MGQFKPMVKMMTTEPSVILKLKKGGHASTKKMKAEEHGTGHKKMADGGVPMMMQAEPMIKRAAPVMVAKAPARPPMAMRRKAMAVKPAMATPMMKKGGETSKEDMAQDKAMIKKAFKQHDMQEHKGDKGTELKLKKGGMKKMATGGVVKGQGGYKDGGMATGGVKKGNSGGYAKGGATKKFANGGTVEDAGRAVKMPQGNKRPSTPVSINQLSGTFKKGGKVKKMADGGQSSMSDNQKGYNQHYADERKFNESLRDDVEKALTYIPRKIGEGAKSVYEAAINSDAAKGLRNYGRLYKEGLGMKRETPYEKDGGAIKKSRSKC
jgi:hypothetical protein